MSVNLEFPKKGLALGVAFLALIAWAAPTNASRPAIDATGMGAIDLDVQGANVSSVLRMFSEFSNRNIIAGPEVEGKVTAKLEGVPWLVALDTVLRANGFGWEETANGGIIRVTTLEKLSNERLNEEVVERRREEFLPLEGHEGVWVFTGRHTAMRWNSNADIGGEPTATLLLTIEPGRSTEFEASILFHEVFHLLSSGQRDLVLDGQLLEFVPPFSRDLLCEIFARKSPRMRRRPSSGSPRNSAASPPTSCSMTPISRPQ